jgi:hypothetical protein
MKYPLVFISTPFSSSCPQMPVAAKAKIAAKT